MKIKRWIVVLLCMLLCVGMLPTMAFAAESYGFRVYDGKKGIAVEVTSDNANDILGDGTVSYNAAANTLMLNNAALTSPEYPGASSIAVPSAIDVYTRDQNLKIELTGENTISGDRCIFVSGSLEITGSGSLNVTGYTYGVYAGGDLTIDGASITANNASGNAISCQGNLTIRNSDCVSGATNEGMVAVDTLSINNSKVTASGPSGDIIPAIVTYHLEISASDVTANGGIQLWDFYSGEAAGRTFSITPADGKLAEFKVDGINTDGSAASHFKEGIKSPYDEAVNFSENEMIWLDAYRYIHIGEHIHSGTATCTEKAVCDDCGEEYGEVNPFNHTNLVKKEAKPATHMTEGNKEYWYCDGCGKYFSDEAGTQEIALVDTVIPKTEAHTADNTGWHFDENSHWNTCECGEIMNKAGHSFEWIVDKEATETEAGSKHEECTVCGYAKDAVEIPATGVIDEPTPEPSPTEDPKPTNKPEPTGEPKPTEIPKPTAEPDANSGKSDGMVSPETGDGNEISVWLMLIAASAAMLTGTALYSKKKK